jgi:hypothetical protein
MSDYIDKFHQVLLDKLNKMEANDYIGTPKLSVTFEYEEDCWDSIKLRVIYPLEFVVGEVKDEDGTEYCLEDWLQNCLDFNEAVRNARKSMEYYTAYDSKIFDEVYLETIKDKIHEIKVAKKAKYMDAIKIMNSETTEKKKVVRMMKLLQKGR